jgi:hypothetical protein
MTKATHPGTIFSQDLSSRVVPGGDGSEARNVAAQNALISIVHTSSSVTHLSMRKYRAPNSAAFASFETKVQVPRRMRRI